MRLRVIENFPPDITDMFMTLDTMLRFDINEFDTTPRNILQLSFLLTEILPSVTPIFDCKRILFPLDEVLAQIWNTDMTVANSIATSTTRHLLSCSTFKGFELSGELPIVEI